MQYQDEVPMLSQDNLRDTQQVGEVEPKRYRRRQYAEERIWKSLWLKHTFTIELLLKKIGEESTSTFSSLIVAIITSNHPQLAGRLHLILADTDLALVFHTLVTWLYYSKPIHLGMKPATLRKLQIVQNVTENLFSDTHCHKYITSILNCLQ